MDSYRQGYETGREDAQREFLEELRSRGFDELADYLAKLWAPKKPKKKTTRATR